MKRFALLAICLCLLSGMLGACRQRGGDSGFWAPPASQVAPAQVIAELDAGAACVQFGMETWQAVIPGAELAAVRGAFVAAGYTEIDAPTVEGKHNPPVVLGAGKVIVTLTGTDAGVRAVWDDTHEAVYSLLSPGENTKKGEGTMVQIGVERNAQTDNPMNGMCYVYKLSDGSAVIIDGGHVSNVDNVYRTLEKMEIAKDAKDKYRITAWVLTHGHADHYGAFMAFAERYGSMADVAYVVYSFPTDGRVLSPSDCNVPMFAEYVRTYYPRAVHVTPHAGLAYHFDNLTLWMLYSPEHLENIDYTNDTSLVFVVELGGARVLHTGDAGERVAELLLASYDKSAFLADAMQITHHGLTTGAGDGHVWKELRELYTATKASIALLPMGTRSPSDARNGRWTVINGWAKAGYQTKFLINNRKSDTNKVAWTQEEYDVFVQEVAAGTAEYKTLCGYDGVNTIVSHRGLVTYIMSAETENMATVFAMSEDEITLSVNMNLYDWFGK